MVEIIVKNSRRIGQPRNSTDWYDSACVNIRIGGHQACQHRFLSLVELRAVFDQAPGSSSNSRASEAAPGFLVVSDICALFPLRSHARPFVLGDSTIIGTLPAGLPRRLPGAPGRYAQVPRGGISVLPVGCAVLLVQIGLLQKDLHVDGDSAQQPQRQR